MMPITRFLKIVEILLISILIASMCSAWIFAQRMRESQQRTERSYDFISLTHELLLSSHLLTSYVRQYVVTGDPRYEQAFQRVVLQRNGESPRPDTAIVAPGATVPLIDLLRETAPSPEDFSLVQLALELSQQLVEVENTAIEAIRRLHQENSSPARSSADWKLAREQAVDIVFSPAYVERTQKILVPLEGMLRARQDVRVFSARQAEIAIIGANVYLVLLIVLLGGVLVLLWYSRKSIQRPMNDIMAFSERIGQGELHERSGENVGNEIGQLAGTFNVMLDRIEVEMARSTIDPLTSVHNRRYFVHKLEEFRAGYDKHGQIFTLLTLDIDFFKIINDTWGHIFGDEILRSFAAILDGCCRADDVLARMGGEEFSILISGDVDNAYLLAERIRRKAEAGLQLPDGKPVTCSVGVAQYQPGQELAVLQGNADVALYQAKRSGRNRVCVFKEGSAAQPQDPTATADGKPGVGQT
ncbi:MAG: diguanylate cyclase [Desulfovibrionaceae bacterium]|nr:diguanylate cyclase [Desulfovibrionaceae bacterium]